MAWGKRFIGQIFGQTIGQKNISVGQRENSWGVDNKQTVQTVQTVQTLPQNVRGLLLIVSCFHGKFMYVFLHLYCFHVLRYFFIVLFGLVWVTTPSVLVPDAVFPGDINRQAFPISLSSSSLLLLLLLLFFYVLSCHNYAVKFMLTDASCRLSYYHLAKI